MPHILAIDQGTTSTRAIVFDVQDARPVASAQVELRQFYPQPGWVEHDPEEIFRATVAVCREAVQKADLRMRDIAALGITNQRETTVLWERATGTPVANAIVWQCRRTADMCRSLVDHGHAPDIRARTGLIVDPYFSATKLRWLLDGGPSGWPDRVRGKSDLQRRAEDGDLCFGTVDSWLLFRLTSNLVHATDSTNASRTMLLNLHDLEWDPALLSLFDIPEAVLPVVKPSAGDFGVTSPEVLGAEIPITGIAGDQHAALYGQACFEPGMTKCTYGTGAFVLSVTGSRPPLSGLISSKGAGARRAVPGGRAARSYDPHPDPSAGSGQAPLPGRERELASDASTAPTGGLSSFSGRGGGGHGLLVTLGWQAGSKRAYALEGSIFVTGAAVQWLRDGLGILADAAETERLAESLDGNDGVYFVPAFVGLGAPHWDAAARGTITGLTLGTTRAHITRAALEATAYQVRDVVEAMDDAAHRRGAAQPLRVDGGQTANSFLMQFQADMLDRPVEVSAVAETTALGAAFLAGRGAGIWKSEREIASLWQYARRYEPQMSDGRRLSLLAGWYDAVRRARLLPPR